MLLIILGMFSMSETVIHILQILIERKEETYSRKKNIIIRERSITNEVPNETLIKT